MRALALSVIACASILTFASPARADDPPPLPDQTEQGEAAEKSIEVRQLPLTLTTPHAGRGAPPVTVYETKRGKIVVVVVAPPPPPGPLGPPPPPQLAPKRSAWPWVLWGSGLLLVTTSIVFELVALREDTEAKNLAYHLTRSDLSPADRAAFDESRESHRDAANRDQAIAITTGAIGIATLAAGVTWLLLTRTRPAAAAPARPPVAVEPRTGGAALSLTF